MIRIVIFAGTLLRAQTLAKLLAEDERFEIVDARAWFRSPDLFPAPMADVILAAGIPFEERLAEDRPAKDPPMVLVSNQPPSSAAFARSVRAWLPENASPSEIAAAIVAAAHDLATLTRAQVGQWITRSRQAQEEHSPSLETLTPREVQVLRMMADGLGNKQIAAQLDISDHTAKFHVAQILAKLGAASRAEAVAIGIRRGLVPI